MMDEFDDNETGWGVYEVGRTPYETEEVHVIPHYGDLTHMFAGKCACEPECRQESEMDLPVYMHRAVYYN